MKTEIKICSILVSEAESLVVIYPRNDYNY